MPTMTGAEFVNTIHQKSEYQDIPIIMHTTDLRAVTESEYGIIDNISFIKKDDNITTVINQVNDTLK